jgi:hypothetical protein
MSEVVIRDACFDMRIRLENTLYTENLCIYEVAQSPNSDKWKEETKPTETTQPDEAQNLWVYRSAVLELNAPGKTKIKTYWTSLNTSIWFNVK